MGALLAELALQRLDDRQYNPRLNLDRVEHGQFWIHTNLLVVFPDCGCIALRIMRQDQEIELFVGNALAPSVLDRRRPCGMIAAMHFESSVAKDHDHPVTAPEMRVPTPRFQLALNLLDLCFVAGDPVDVPEAQ